MNATVSFRIGTPGYLTAVAALSSFSLLVGCGGSSGSTVSDVEKAVGVRSPDSSDIRCEEHGDFDDQTLYRCRADVPSNNRAMRPAFSCYTFEDGRLENVTRHVSC